MNEIENNTTAENVDNLDSLENILSGYTKPFVDETPAPTVNETKTTWAPWENNANDTGKPDEKISGISIEHNPSGSDPEIRYYKSGPKKGQPRPPRKGQTVSKPTTLQASAFLTGAILLSMVDMLLPMAMAGLNNWRSKVKIKADDLKLSEANKKELTPIADAVLKELNIVASPSLLLGVALFGAYAANMMMVRSEAEAKQKLEKFNNNYESNKATNFAPPSKNDVRSVPNTHY